MVNTLSGSVSAYRKEIVKPRFIRIDEVMALLDVTRDEAMDIALAAGARYQLAKIILVHKERLMKFMKHFARVPSSNKIVEKKFVRIGEASMTYSIGHHRFIEMARAVYVVHDNTAHVHSHIVFNSVSFVDGKKYRYEKGDWAKYIQPITNKLCQEYGLSIIDVDDGSKEKEHESYKDWSEYREGSFVWADMIKRDLDSCILQAGNYEQFLELLSDKGYEVKQGKYLAVKPQGMTRFRRCKTLGDMYSDEAIRERIEKEDISFYREQQKEVQPVLCKCKVRRYRRAKMSGLQKRYYAKLYRIGKLKKKPYSQVWKYKEDIRKMHKLQEEYLFLVNHDIHSAEELVSVISSLTDKRKEVSAEKSRIYKARERSRELFDTADDMKELEPAEKSFLQGDVFFTDEHLQWETLKQKLLSQGYSLEEVEALRKHYKEEYSKACAKERAVFKELNIGKSIWKSLIPDSVSDGKDAQYNKETIRDRKEQPER